MDALALPSRAAAMPPSAPRLPWQSWVRGMLPWCTVPAVLLAVEALVLAGAVDGRYLPRPSSVMAGVVQLLGQPSLWSNAAATWSAALYGFALGLAIAIPAGLVAGGNAVVWHVFRPVVEFLRPLPTVAMIPLVVLLWGPSTFSKAFLVCFTTVWPVFIQTAYSVRDTNPTAIETARSFGLGRFAVARRIVLPSALPGIATAVRIQVSIALLVTITSEVALGGGGGLGILVFQLDQAGDYVGMYALLVLIGAQGMLVSSLLARAERRLMPWHAGHREEQP